MAKKAKHSDAVMTGILVTQFKTGQIDVDDLEERRLAKISCVRRRVRRIKNQSGFP